MGQIGAVRNTRGGTQIPGVNGALTSISINGSPAASERIRIDGLDATYTLGNAYYSFGSPSVDSVQEVAIQTSNFAAEYGQTSGAVLSYTMRSGTNQFHGSAYEYWVNEDFNSAGAYSHTRPKTRKNDFGGTSVDQSGSPRSTTAETKLFSSSVSNPFPPPPRPPTTCSLFPRVTIEPGISARPWRRLTTRS